MERVRRILLHFIAFPALSRLYGRLTRIRRPRKLVRRVIHWFVRVHSIDMTRFRGEPGDYPSLADFFVRPLDDAVIPEPLPGFLVSPADGILASLESVSGDAATQVKGLTYSLSQLVGEHMDFSHGWHVATVYLSPADYHRFHHPLGGRVISTRRLGGSRFPVNAMGSRLIPRLFVRNERVVVKYNTRDEIVYLAAVGATFVGGIHMTVPLPPKRGRKPLPQDSPVRQLDELGRFDLGSTIVILVPAELADPVAPPPGGRVLVGTPLFNLRAKSKEESRK